MGSYPVELKLRHAHSAFARMSGYSRIQRRPPPVVGGNDEPREVGILRLTMLVPQSAIGRVIGRSGSIVGRLRAESGCMIHISNGSVADGREVSTHSRSPTIPGTCRHMEALCLFALGSRPRAS